MERTSRAKVGRDALLRAAGEIFLERGYEATGIDAIIARAGGSKRNIYSEFGNKEGLFTAIVTENVDEALAALAIERRGGDDLGALLFQFGCRLLDILLSPALIGIYRIVVTEHARFPALVRRFYEQGPGRASARLAEILAEARNRGQIAAEDCDRAADQFFGMVRGNLHLQVVLGLRPVPDPPAIRALVACAVDTFLDGIRANRASRDP